MIPIILAGRQVIEGHYFDISKNPVEIVWLVKELSVEERKNSLLNIVLWRTKSFALDELDKDFNENLESQQRCCV